MHCFVREIYVIKSRLHKSLVFLFYGATLLLLWGKVKVRVGERRQTESGRINM